MTDFVPHRLFCATWTDFRADFTEDQMPHTSKTAEGLADFLNEAGVLADAPVLIANRDAIAVRNCLDDFMAGPGESLILYFGSHGLLPSAGTSTYRLATGDTRAVDDGIRAFPINEIVAKVTSGDAANPRRHIMLILDSCYSGWVAQDFSTAVPATFDKGPLERPGLTFLASSSPYEPSVAPADAPTTAFGKHLIDALRGPRPVAGLRVEDLYDRIKQAATAAGNPRPVCITQDNSQRALVLPAQLAEPTWTPQFDNRAAVLYVDDIEDERYQFKKVLEGKGHSVTTVDDPASARECLKTSHFDVVVLDLLLVGDIPAVDLIRFVGRYIRNSKVIIASRRDMGRTAWTHLDSVFAHPNSVDAFVFKSDHITQASEFADQIRTRRTQILSHVQGVDELTPLVAGRVVKRKDAGHELGHEVLQLHARICVEQLVARWFSTESDATDYIESMTMEPLGSGRSSCSVFSLTPTIRGLDASHVSPLLLKIGPLDEIREEFERFNKYVQVGVPLSVRTDLVGFASAGAIGAIIYSLIGGDQRDIREAATLPADEVDRCLRKLMDPKGKRWLASTGPDDVRPSAFFQKNSAATKNPWSLKRFFAAAAALNAGLRKAGLPEEFTVHQYFSERPRADIVRPSTLVHGDLHLGNIVAFGDSNYALIDYRNVGIGPRCADFATLEVDCWLLATPDPQGDRAQQIRGIYDAAGGGLHDERSADEIAPWLHDSWRLALTCRELARENFRDMTADEYGSQLWFTAVRRSEMRMTATTKAEIRALKTFPHALALAAQDLVTAR